MAPVEPIAAGNDAQETPVDLRPPSAATLRRPRPLWRKVGAHTWPRPLPSATPPSRSDEEYVVTATDIERREKKTGRVLDRVAFPRYFLADDVDHLQLLLDGERVALMSPMYGGFIMTWKGTSAPEILNLPIGMESVLGLRGDTLKTAQILPPPPLGPREVHVTRDFQLFATGGFPERGDGTVLRPVGKQSIDVWQGPLRWSR